MHFHTQFSKFLSYSKPRKRIWINIFFDIILQILIRQFLGCQLLETYVISCLLSPCAMLSVSILFACYHFATICCDLPVSCAFFKFHDDYNPKPQICPNHLLFSYSKQNNDKNVELQNGGENKFNWIEKGSISSKWVSSILDHSKYSWSFKTTNQKFCRQY